MQLLNDFIDGELPEIEHSKVEQHVNECIKCNEEFEFLRTLSRDAASLPKSIQPDKDLWPGIEAGITTVPLSENAWGTTTNSERKYHRRKAAAWTWLIAAAALLAGLALAGTYLEMGKQAAKNSTQGVSSNAAEKQGPAQPPLTPSLFNQPAAPAEKMTGIAASPAVRSPENQQSANILTYPLDGITFPSVSNYGIYGVHLDIDPSREFLRNYIIRFYPNGTQSWAPPLPLGSIPISLYAGGRNRLWIAYSVQQPESQTFIAELDLGAESQIRNIWKSNDLYLHKFVMSPQGLIYAAGYRSEFSKAVPKLTKGQSITTELAHIIDPVTGEERHFSPITIRPKFDTPNWIGSTLAEAGSLMPTIAVKSNGNFFSTTDRTRVSESARDLIKNEAVEYSPDGTMARTWELGTLERNAYLNRIFVDVDDSILAEILEYPDTFTADTTPIIDRYLLRVDPNGRVTRYQPSFPLDEIIQGWVGQTQDLVTLVSGPGKSGKRPEIRIHRLSP